MKKTKKPTPKPTPRPYVTAVFFAAMFAASPAFAQTAGNANECMAFADMAIVARALAAIDVKEPQMRTAIASIYNTNEGHAPMVDGIVRLAYASKLAPKDFSTAFGTYCIDNTGKMDSCFGKPV